MKYRDVILRVTLRNGLDPEIETEILFAQMRVREDSLASQKLEAKLAALPEGDSTEREAITAEFSKLQSRLDPLENAIVFNPRRVICRRIVAQFVEWNVALPLDFDAIFDSPLSDKELQTIYETVVNEPTRTLL